MCATSASVAGGELGLDRLAVIGVVLAALLEGLALSELAAGSSDRRAIGVAEARTVHAWQVAIIAVNAAARDELPPHLWPMLP